MCVCRSSSKHQRRRPTRIITLNITHTTTTTTATYNKPQTTTKAINMHWIKCLLTAFICFTVIVQVSASPLLLPIHTYLSFLPFLSLTSPRFARSLALFVATATCCCIFFYLAIPAFTHTCAPAFCSCHTYTHTQRLCVCAG